MSSREPVGDNILTPLVEQIYNVLGWLFSVVIIFYTMMLTAWVIIWIFQRLFIHDERPTKEDLNQEPENRLESDWDENA